MVDGVFKQNVRAAVAGYVLRRWNVDCSDDHGLRGGEYQLWLKNSPALYGVENVAIVPNHKILIMTQITKRQGSYLSDINY